MKAILIFFTIVFFVCSSCHKGPNTSNNCNGDTRRKVKLMIDEKARLVDTIPIFTTIDSLGALAVPVVNSETDRQDLELQMYTVKCFVEKVDQKHDGDYHIRLQSGDNYLITEVPNPNCEYAKNSYWNAAFKKVFDFIEANDLEGKEVVITGVAFVDIEHPYKRKQAANNLELHPIIKISF